VHRAWPTQLGDGCSRSDKSLFSCESRSPEPRRLTFVTLGPASGRSVPRTILGHAGHAQPDAFRRGTGISLAHGDEHQTTFLHAPLAHISASNHAKRWQGFAERWGEAIEIGYLRLEHGLVAHAGNVFGECGVEPELEMPPMTAAQAIHLLHMHKHRVHGVGGRPGRHGRPKSLNDPDIRASILRKFERIEARRIAEERVDRATLARDEADWARRRAPKPRPGGE
jgi:hypothetical protein